MVKSKDSPKDKMKKSAKENLLLICVLIALVFAIIGLVISIVLRNRLEETARENGGGTGETTQIVEQQVGEVAPGEAVLEDDEEVNTKILEIQKQLTGADSETKAKLYWERIDYIWATVGTEAYQNQVISDAIAADEIRQTPDSAFQVVNVATTYGDDELGEEYDQKGRERLEAQGVDLSQPGSGSDRTDEE